MNDFFLTRGKTGELTFIFCTYRRALAGVEIEDACAFWRARHRETVSPGWALFVDLRPAFREPLDVSRAQEVEAVEFGVENPGGSREIVTIRNKTVRQEFEEC